MHSILEALWGLWIVKLLVAYPVLLLPLAYGAFVTAVVFFSTCREEGGVRWVGREIRAMTRPTHRH